MPDVFTPELTFGPAQSGIMTPTAPGLSYRTIQRGVAAFNPLTLSPHAWYDPSDLSTMFQTGTRGAPGAAVTTTGDPVGLILDKSGNNNDLVQATSTKRPLYTVAGAAKYLLFDGVDDFMSCTTVSMVQPTTQFVAGQMVGGTTSRFFDGVARQLLGSQTGTDMAIYALGSVIAAVQGMPTTDLVWTGNFNGVSSVLYKDGVSFAAGDAGASGLASLVVGASNGTATEFLSGKVHGLIFVPGTVPNLAPIVTYLGAKQGRTI